jgi:hypothetical protein
MATTRTPGRECSLAYRLHVLRWRLPGSGDEHALSAQSFRRVVRVYAQDNEEWLMLAGSAERLAEFRSRSQLRARSSETYLVNIRGTSRSIASETESLMGMPA